jgi:mono/diheme cytochrome c family protein
MTNRKQEPRPIPALAYALAVASAAGFIVGLAVFATPDPADALPSYAQQTKLACGRCHVSAAGGGALTGFGKAYVANGHKVPSKGAKTGKPSTGDATPYPRSRAHRRTPGIRGTASVFFTTSPGVSNQSATFECFNCGVFVDPR